MFDGNSGRPFFELKRKPEIRFPMNFISIAATSRGSFRRIRLAQFSTAVSLTVNQHMIVCVTGWSKIIGS